MNYRVEKKVDGEWYPEGTWDDPIKLGLAMWELGLQRPDYEAIRIVPDGQVQVSAEQLTDKCVQYLMEHHQCSELVAGIALNENGGSVIHAGVMLDSPYERARLERKARDAM